VERTDATPPADTRSPRPWGLLAAAAAVVVEVLGLVSVVVLYAVLILRSGAVDALGAVLTAVLAALVAAGLLACVRALLAGRRWSRAPILTWQLLQALVSYPLVTTAAGPGIRWLGLVLVALSVVAVVGLFTPAAVRATTPEDERDEPPVL
jgi:hypothetical protein